MDAADDGASSWPNGEINSTPTNTRIPPIGDTRLPGVSLSTFSQTDPARRVSEEREIQVRC